MLYKSKTLQNIFNIRHLELLDISSKPELLIVKSEKKTILFSEICF